MTQNGHSRWNQSQTSQMGSEFLSRWTCKNSIMLIYFVYQKEDDRSVDICIECLYLAISFVKSHVRALYIIWASDGRLH